MSDNDYDYDVFEVINERWPKSSDQLFAPGRPLHLAQNADERLYRLIKGYKRAGDVLIQRALADSLESRNLVYPAVFCYRHYVELALKHLIKEHGPLSDTRRKKIDHKLENLWLCFRELAAEYGGSDTDDIEVVGKLIGELAAVDPGSVTFRFATDRNDVPIPLPIASIDPIRLRDVMNGIENFLECADLHFDTAKKASPF